MRNHSRLFSFDDFLDGQFGNQPNHSSQFLDICLDCNKWINDHTARMMEQLDASQNDYQRMDSVMAVIFSPYFPSCRDHGR